MKKSILFSQKHVIGLMSLMVFPAHAGDGVPVTSAVTTRSAAAPSGPYSIGSYNISYGVGDNVKLVSVVAGGTALGRSAVSKPSITINRIDNSNVTGERLTFFYPGVVSGSSVLIEGDEAASMEEAMNDDYLTSGGLDVFLNVDTGVERANNIERVDFIVSNGMTLPTTTALLGEIGTVANEKHGNNTYKIAMITGLDNFGEPASYGALKTVQGSVDYGNIGRPKNSGGIDLNNLYMRNGPTPMGLDNGPVAYIGSDTNFIGLSFVSFGTMGATPGQTVYGYSLFPNDMFDGNDLVGLSDAPLNTSGGINGGDIYGGTFAIFSSKKAESETSENIPNLSTEKTIAIYDPLGEGLYAIPGNDIVYTISVSNAGSGSPDPNTLFLVDTLPPDCEFYNGDADGPGPESDPVIFADSGTGMTFDYATDAGYATGATAPADFSACTYSPAAGYDPNVKFVCLLPSGMMAGGAAPPSFDLQFRARIR